ncbi:MAG: SDR family NAD(P)-dependent oxidoreductase, partial [Chitinophagaceae bacterium]
MNTVKQKNVAIVTGGGSGLGLAIAEKFTNAGIETIIAGRDKEKLEAAKLQLGEL